MRDHRVAAAPLGGVERAVRSLDQIGGQLIVLRHQRFDADADRDKAAGYLIVGDNEIFDARLALLGKRGRAPDSIPGSSSANSSPP